MQSPKVYKGHIEIVKHFNVKNKLHVLFLFNMLTADLLNVLKNSFNDEIH